MPSNRGVLSRVEEKVEHLGRKQILFLDPGDEKMRVAFG